jgi:hypothetical protein
MRTELRITPSVQPHAPKLRVKAGIGLSRWQNQARQFGTILLHYNH